MEIDKTQTIWRRKRAIDMAREDEQRERMREYDQTVYNPALAVLRAECAAAGHGQARIERNGLGWAWTQCTSCGGRVEQWSELEEDEGGR